MAQPKPSTAGQVTRFGAVGILNTVIDYVIYISLTKLFSIPLERVWIAKLVSGSVAMINSFYFNKKFVFGRGTTNKHAGRQFARFLVATIVAVYVIQLGLVQLLTSNYPQIGKLVYTILSDLGIAQLVPNLFTQSFTVKTTAFVLATGASLVWNFLLYKLWAFKE